MYNPTVTKYIILYNIITDKESITVFNMQDPHTTLLRNRMLKISYAPYFVLSVANSEVKCVVGGN